MNKLLGGKKEPLKENAPPGKRPIKDGKNRRKKRKEGKGNLPQPTGTVEGVKGLRTDFMAGKNYSDEKEKKNKQTEGHYPSRGVPAKGDGQIIRKIVLRGHILKKKYFVGDHLGLRRPGKGTRPTKKNFAHENGGGTSPSRRGVEVQGPEQSFLKKKQKKVRSEGRRMAAPGSSSIFNGRHAKKKALGNRGVEGGKPPRKDFFVSTGGQPLPRD